MNRDPNKMRREEIHAELETCAAPERRAQLESALRIHASLDRIDASIQGLCGEIARTGEFLDLLPDLLFPRVAEARRRAELRASRPRRWWQR